MQLVLKESKPLNDFTLNIRLANFRINGSNKEREYVRKLLKCKWKKSFIYIWFPILIKLTQFPSITIYQ
jgi:hypothetical protein